MNLAKLVSVALLGALVFWGILYGGDTSPPTGSGASSESEARTVVVNSEKPASWVPLLRTGAEYEHVKGDGMTQVVVKEKSETLGPLSPADLSVARLKLDGYLAAQRGNPSPDLYDVGVTLGVVEQAKSFVDLVRSEAARDALERESYFVTPTTALPSVPSATEYLQVTITYEGVPAVLTVVMDLSVYTKLRDAKLYVEQLQKARPGQAVADFNSRDLNWRTGAISRFEQIIESSDPPSSKDRVFLLTYFPRGIAIDRGNKVLRLR